MSDSDSDSDSGKDEAILTMGYFEMDELRKMDHVN